MLSDIIKVSDYCVQCANIYDMCVCDYANTSPTDNWSVIAAKEYSDEFYLLCSYGWEPFSAAFVTTSSSAYVFFRKCREYGFE